MENSERNNSALGDDCPNPFRPTSCCSPAPVCPPRSCPSPCGPCAPSPCGPCMPSPCGPCAPSPCGPCMPLTCSPCAPSPCGPCMPLTCSPCAPSPCGPCKPSPCGPCAPSPCGPCMPSPCGPCAPSPCGPCMPSPCGPCALSPCGPCNPCAPCGPCKPCGPYDPCSPCGLCPPCNSPCMPLPTCSLPDKPKVICPPQYDPLPFGPKACCTAPCCPYPGAFPVCVPPCYVPLCCPCERTEEEEEEEKKKQVSDPNTPCKTITCIRGEDRAACSIVKCNCDPCLVCLENGEEKDSKQNGNGNIENGNGEGVEEIVGDAEECEPHPNLSRKVSDEGDRENGTVSQRSGNGNGEPGKEKGSFGNGKGPSGSGNGINGNGNDPCANDNLTNGNVTDPCAKFNGKSGNGKKSLEKLNDPCANGNGNGLGSYGGNGCRKMINSVCPPLVLDDCCRPICPPLNCEDESEETEAEKTKEKEKKIKRIGCDDQCNNRMSCKLNFINACEKPRSKKNDDDARSSPYCPKQSENGQKGKRLESTYLTKKYEGSSSCNGGSMGTTEDVCAKAESNSGCKEMSNYVGCNKEETSYGSSRGNDKLQVGFHSMNSKDIPSEISGSKSSGGCCSCKTATTASSQPRRSMGSSPSRGCSGCNR